MNIRTIQPKPAPKPVSARLAHLRATYASCYESEFSIYQHHKWVAGRCVRCGDRPTPATR